MAECLLGVSRHYCVLALGKSVVEAIYSFRGTLQIACSVKGMRRGKKKSLSIELIINYSLRTL